MSTRKAQLFCDLEHKKKYKLLAKVKFTSEPRVALKGTRPGEAQKGRGTLAGLASAGRPCECPEGFADAADADADNYFDILSLSPMLLHACVGLGAALSRSPSLLTSLLTSISALTAQNRPIPWVHVPPSTQAPFATPGCAC